MNGRYQVIRHPGNYQVADMQHPQHRRVFASRNRGRAHAEAERLNRKHRRER